MSMELGVFQSPGLSQQLNLAPQLLQWLRLLQVPTTELSTLVRHELETNPALELGDPGSNDASDLADAQEAEAGEDSLEKSDLEAKLNELSLLDADWRSDYFQSRSDQAGSVQAEQEKHQFILDSAMADASLQEHLLRQLSACSLPAEQQALAELIVGSLDERGYLMTPLTELAELSDLPLVAAETVLARVQELDPAGVGSRDLRECLLLQLEAADRPDDLPVVLVRDHLEALSQNPKNLALQLSISEEDLFLAMEKIRALDPSPASSFSRRPVEYIEPDATIFRQDGAFVIELNDDSIPHLRLSAECRRMLEEKKLTAEDRAYIRRKIRHASFLIQGLSQRQDTLRRVIQEIVRVQGDFFRQSEGELQPLTMVKVAGLLGVHETTVSRAIANKYIRTPRGVFEMKHFFRAGYQCSDGSAVTPDSVKDTIAALIKQEDPSHPLTDLHIVDMLRKKGLRLARRTVAKYRDELNLASSKDRFRPLASRKMIQLPSEPVLEPESEPQALVCSG